MKSCSNVVPTLQQRCMSRCYNRTFQTISPGYNVAATLQQLLQPVCNVKTRFYLSCRNVAATFQQRCKQRCLYVAATLHATAHFRQYPLDATLLQLPQPLCNVAERLHTGVLLAGLQTWLKDDKQ